MDNNRRKQAATARSAEGMQVPTVTLQCPSMPLNCLQSGPTPALISTNSSGQNKVPSNAAPAAHRRASGQLRSTKLGEHTGKVNNSGPSSCSTSLNRSKQERAAASNQASRSTLLAAVALQDHLARTIGIPGGPTSQPSIQPGASMTLAQHLGLVPRPPPLLSKTDWNEVHLKARLRQHSTTQCLICWEDFKADPQVLLSCSHVFHKACLASFERYARVRCCPMCRAEQYQKKVIQDGAEAYKHQCATRIQAVFRGWLARRQVHALRRHHPPKDPRLKRNWAAERLEEQGDRLVAGLEAARGDLDALWAELDAGLALSRAVCGQVDAPAARRLQEQLQVEEAITRSLQDGGNSSGSSSNNVMPGDHSRPPENRSGRQLQDQIDSHSCSSSSDVDWDSVVAKAKARGQLECPICIGKLDRRGKAGIAWLSCSHAFHLDCITAFEGYELSAGGVPTCPCCRAQYQRKCFT